jgi:hypothetical protein
MPLGGNGVLVKVWVVSHFVTINETKNLNKQQRRNSAVIRTGAKRVSTVHMTDLI